MNLGEYVTIVIPCKNENLIIQKTKGSFSILKVLVIGEIIIDEFVYCDVLGKSG